MNRPQRDDLVDELLALDAEQHIADDGFTARVVQQLPKRRQNQALRWVIFTIAIGIGGAIASSTMPPAFDLAQEASANLGEWTAAIPGSSSTLISAAAVLFSLWFYRRLQVNA